MIDVMVVGCGTMGSGIASSFLKNPKIKVIVVESNVNVLKKLSIPIQDSVKETLQKNGVVQYSSNLWFTTDLSYMKQPPKLIVEAIPERRDMKKELYRRIEEMYPKDVIVGSNTSTLPLQEMADWFKYPERFVGMHYNHPAHIVPIVEVVKMARTNQSCVDVVLNLLKECGKIPVVLKKPIDGFITNRLQHAMYREIYSIMEDGSVDAEDIDNVAKYMFGPRMSVTGLLLQKDCSGLDTHTYAQREMVKVLANNTVCGPVLENKFKNGHHGLKAGQGFYNWKGTGDPDKVQNDVNNRLEKVFDYLEKNKVPYHPSNNAKL